MAIPVSAASKENAGAKLPKYSKVIEKTVDTSNFDRSMRQLIEEAGEEASNSVQYKIIIPPGTYTSSWTLFPRSNTWIYAKGATIKGTKTGKGTQILTPYQSTRTRNIVIEGGTWTVTNQSKSFAPQSALFRALGVTNMIMKDMTIRSNRRSHVIEVADMNGFTVQNCKIDSGKTSPATIQPKEAIQLDVATTGAMPNYYCPKKMLNGKGCHSVRIKNCTFTNCQRGVGAHSGIPRGVQKKPYTNIIVEDCTFKNLKGEAVFAQNWRASTIRDNKITTCRRTGIYLHETYTTTVMKNQITDIRRFASAAQRKSYGTYATGVLFVSSNSNKIMNNKVTKYSSKAVTAVSGKKNTIKANKGYKKRK